MLKLIFVMVFLLPCYSDDPLLSKFWVGEVEVWALLDGSGINKPYTLYFPDKTLSDWNGLTDIYNKPYIGPDGIFTSPTAYTAFLIRSQGKVILVDDALGIVYPIAVSDQKVRIPDLINRAGFNISQIDYLVHTHLHRDHTGWDVNFNELHNVVFEFSKTLVFTYKTEWDYWTSSPQNMNASAYQGSILAYCTNLLWILTILQEVLQYVKQSNQLVLLPEGDHSLTFEVTVKFCPGHTPGHACVEINSGGMTAIISGDVIHHPAQVQMWAWRDVFDWNDVIATNTRKELILRCAREGILLFSNHFTHPSVGHIVPYHSAPTNQSGYIFVPVE